MILDGTDALRKTSMGATLTSSIHLFERETSPQPQKWTCFRQFGRTEQFLAGHPRAASMSYNSHRISAKVLRLVAGVTHASKRP
jgi:hypothetical protein